MSNTWVICLRVGDNDPKGSLIPHNILPLDRWRSKLGIRKDLTLGEEPAAD